MWVAPPQCAQWSPLAIDLCGTTWGHVFDTRKSEAQGHVTLSCYPHAFSADAGAAAPSTRQKAPSAQQRSSADAEPSCHTSMPDDVDDLACETWCDAAQAMEHCKWCKCRGCHWSKDACAAELAEAATVTAQRAAQVCKRLARMVLEWQCH